MEYKNMHFENLIQKANNRLKECIVSRHNEIHLLSKNYEYTLQGSSRTCFIKGGAGLGKTTLVNQLLSDISLHGDITSVCGKFNQYNEEQLCALSEIIEQLVDNLLTLLQQELEKVKKAILNDIGDDVGLIIAINPYVHKIFKSYSKIIIHDYPKLLYRIQKSVYLFIKNISEILNPLIIFVDDLQWADNISLDIINYMCNKLNSINILFLFAFRDNVEEYNTKVNSIITNKENINNIEVIQLSHLLVLDIEKILDVVFYEGLENKTYFAKELYRLSMGTPFYIKQLINVFLEKSIIIFEQNKQLWTVNYNYINKMELSEDIRNIVINKIKEFDGDIRLLEIIACLGGKISSLLVKIFFNEKEDDNLNRLNNLCNTGLIKHTISQGITIYEFSHDVILELIYGNIENVNKEEIHFFIVNKLLKNKYLIDVKMNKLCIASQILNSQRLIIEEGDNNKWLKEAYFCGLEAKETASVETALRLFKLCEKLLFRSAQANKKEMSRRIKLEIAECLFICGDYDQSKLIFEELVMTTNNKEELVYIKSKFMMLYSYIGDYNKVISLGIENLGHLDYKIGQENTKWNLYKKVIIARYFHGKSNTSKLRNKHPIEDERIISVLNILTGMAPAANLINEDLFPLIIIEHYLLTMKYGNSIYSSLGYIAYSFMLCNIWDKYQEASELKDLSIDLLEAIPNDSIYCIVNFLIGTFIEHWLTSCEKSLKYLERTINSGLKIGDFLYVGYSNISIIEMKYVMGRPLEELNPYLNLTEEYSNKMNYDIIHWNYKVYKSHLASLGFDNYTKDLIIDEEEINTLDTSLKITYYTFKVHKLFLENKIEEAYQLIEDRIDNIINVLKGYILYADLIFYIVLVRIKKHNTLSYYRKVHNKKVIKKYIRKIKQFINITPSNHLSRYLYIQAIYSANFNKENKFNYLVEKGIQNAKDNDQLQLEALGNYIAADYYSNNKRICETYAKDSIKLYRYWGSRHIVECIKDRFNIEENLHNNIISETNSINENTKTAINDINKPLLYHMQKLENAKEDNIYKYILSNILNVYDADYGAILIENNDEMGIKYETDEKRKLIVNKDLINIDSINYLSQRIVRYVARTGKDIIIKTKPTNGIFANDSYIRGKDDLSVLCIPIKYKKIFAGILYLHWTLPKIINDNMIEEIKSFSFPLIALYLDDNITDNNNDREENIKLYKLTERELEILDLIAEGITNKQIATKLHIALSTVKTHTLNIYSKLDVNSRVQAVIKGKELNILKD